MTKECGDSFFFNSPVYNFRSGAVKGVINVMSCVLQMP